MYFVKLPLMLPQINLDGLSRDVMNMNLNDNKGDEDQSKGAANSGFRQNLILVN